MPPYLIEFVSFLRAIFLLLKKFSGICCKSATAWQNYPGYRTTIVKRNPSLPRQLGAARFSTIRKAGQTVEMNR